MREGRAAPERKAIARMDGLGTGSLEGKAGDDLIDDEIGLGRRAGGPMATDSSAILDVERVPLSAFE